MNPRNESRGVVTLAGRGAIDVMSVAESDAQHAARPLPSKHHAPAELRALVSKSAPQMRPLPSKQDRSDWGDR